MEQTKRPLILIAVMLAMFVAAVEATIVSTAMPSIAADLGGFSKYSWVFSAYLLMSTVTVLLYGKLADLVGRKAIFAFGMLLFLIGSGLCGLADSMEQLIAFRFIQGAGAGAIMPIASTIVGDIYSPEERAKIQGYLSSVWGISAIAGPAIGGVLVATIGWQYVFWVNLPLGMLSLLGILIYLKEPVRMERAKVDYRGALFLTIALSSVLYLLIEGGVSFGWLSAPSYLLVTIGALFMFWFIKAERASSDPMMPFEIWQNRAILYANLVSLATGIILIGISSYLPAYVTGVMEQPAAIAGFTLTTMSIGWPIASVLSGRLLISIGYFRTSLLGGSFLLLGTALFIMMQPGFGPLWAGMSSFFVGIGMGLTSTAFIVSIQSAVSYDKRGAATASNMFMRNLGSTIGVALLGSILNSSLLSRLDDSGNNLSLESVNSILSIDSRLQLPEADKLVLQEALAFGLRNVYSIAFLCALVSFLLIFGLRGLKGVKPDVK
ncbi:MFS transporter [Planococcus sp. CP5-4]|uniref:MDR family MFS transporter n=1 Tax=unclassified Planococcus (in: firmicutes) TaxID=2662419 RepID=UPI001C250814|nr:MULTISPECIES: MDR family MFS transporter [unclassified Planococcus (in: firmicutes)]MBU9672223.1 MFS transporter [Planococcus sp. CP5-4_YE]MBV0907786.1 MFS transporter [Planococcus sp. CP5-4_UN]MBW6062953.1 MFS transporter [Planococcus sp. CP5-4]